MSQDKHWYIAIVANNTEMVSAEKLGRDFTVYLPSQQYVSIWKDGRWKIRQRILFPGKLLIYCTEKERLSTFSRGLVKRYMVDVAKARDEFGRSRVAVVPNAQVEMLRFVLGQSDAKVEIDNASLCVGEQVQVIRGSLRGLKGVVAGKTSGKTRVQIKIDYLGCASVEVNIDDVERVY